MSANSRPLKPGNEGKFIEPSTPPAFMSLMRSWMSQQPGRISSKAVGSMPYSSLGRPATAFSPMLGIFEPSNSQTSEPSLVRMTFGARSRYLAGMCCVEHRRRLDQVVVDADQDQIFCLHRMARFPSAPHDLGQGRLVWIEP